MTPVGQEHIAQIIKASSHSTRLTPTDLTFLYDYFKRQATKITKDTRRIRRLSRKEAKGAE
jgi:hypothetical protein